MKATIFRSSVTAFAVAAAVCCSQSASAQSISGLAIAKNVGNSANLDNADADVFSAVSVVTPNVQTRYAAIVLADIAVGNITPSLTADYQVSFNATAPGDYTVTVATRLDGAFSCVDDTIIVPFSGNADITGVTGSVTTGPPVASGSLNIADPGILTTTGNVTFAPTASAQIHGTSAGAGQPHSLRFQFGMSANSSADECATKIGLGSSQSGQSVGGSPGNGATNGHFVTLTLTSYCGNGVLDSARGEQCDPSIGGTGPCCTSACRFASPSTQCRAGGVCDPAEFCTGGSSTCPSDSLDPPGEPCGSPSDTVCDNPDTCNGSGTCLPNNEPPTTECRAGGVCDPAENCDGAGNCPANVFDAPGEPCGDPSDTVCDNPDTCNGSGTCLANNEPPTTECRAGGVCDPAENCDGAGSCPADALDPPGEPCGDPSDTVCDNPDTCNGSGTCLPNYEPGTTECRTDAGECDVPENCDGAGSCPVDSFEPPGEPCGDPSDTDCTDPDSCDGSGSCLDNHEPNTTECRPIAGVCDVAENCDGAGNCPADGFEPDTTLCRPDAGDCDVPEFCLGGGTNAADCPADVFEPEDTACGDPSNTVCDNPDSCDDAGTCLDNNEPATTECRAQAGVCDIAENCDGAGSCPPDAVEPNTTICRPDAGECDVPDFCLGGGTNANDCPADGFEPSGTSCGSPTNSDCTNPDTCNGSGACQANDEAPGFPCGDPSNTDCTDPDTCNGSGTCLSNHAPNGTACDDSNSCTTPDQCTGGLCIPGASTQCLDHYKCYKAKDLKMPKFVRQTVNLSDQFGPDNGVSVLKPAYVCNPVDKDGGGINNPVDHLTCYKIKGSGPFQNVQTTDQFGTLKLTAKKSKLLCVPGSKTVNP